jgi:hypothetical protein
VNPATKQTIPCSFNNQTFAQAVFDVYLNAEPLRKIDWWWTDYGETSDPVDRRTNRRLTIVANFHIPIRGLRRR